VAGDVSGVTLQWVPAGDPGDIGVSPPSGTWIPLDAEDAGEIALTFDAPAGAAPGDYTGWIDLEDDAGGTTTVPYLLRVFPAAPQRDLLIVDLSFSEENERPDVTAIYGELADALGLSWELATPGEHAWAPSMPELFAYRAVLVVTGDDRWNQYGTSARWTLDRLAGYLLRGGRVIVAGQGPLRDASHERAVALLGGATLEHHPLWDGEQDVPWPVSELRVTATDQPALISADLTLDASAPLGDVYGLGEVVPVTLVTDLEPWGYPVLRLTDGDLRAGGNVGLVYDPFPHWGSDSLAEAHRHRAVMLGFGLELVREPTPGGGPAPAPGSRAELLQRAWRWVSDRVSLQVAVHHTDRELTLEAFAEAGTPVVRFEYDYGDGSPVVRTHRDSDTHRYERYDDYEVTVIARSETGAAALWRRIIDVQPAATDPDAGLGDGSVTADASGAAGDQGGGRGCHCRGAGSDPGAGLGLGIGLGFAFLLLLVPWLLARRGGRGPWRVGGWAARARSRQLPLLLAGGLSVAAISCEREAAEIKRAYERVIDHSQEGEQRYTIWKKKQLPGFVWAVRENRDNPNRGSLDMDIAVSPLASRERVKKRLRQAVRIGKGATSLDVVRVQAWPKGLQVYGGVLGTAHLAPDGRGWDGQGNTVRGVRVITGQDKGVWRPSAFDIEVLRALEKRQRIMMADPRYSGKHAYFRRRPKALQRAVIAEVAPQLGLTRSSVRRTVRNARKYWWKPSWQPSAVVDGQ
jgi:hypothetical protein